MQEGLELKWRVSLIRNDQSSEQAFPIEGDAIDKAELVRPERSAFFAEVLGRETKVELHARERTFTCRLSKEFPT